MPRPISVTIPHQLGAAEAKRRIVDGFGNVQRQWSTGMLAAVTFTNHWENDRLCFEGGALGQRVSGRVEVLADSVRIELDLPAILAAIAERITGKLRGETQKLLERQ